MNEIFNNFAIIPIKEIFYLTDRINLSTGLAIIMISIAIKIFLFVPEKWANKYTEIKKNKFDDIKKEIKAATLKLKGEDKFNVINQIYRKNNHNPFSEIILITPFLVQIPFFIIIFYTFQNINNEIFLQKTFYILNDLSLPDSLINIFYFKINFLPILMTIINILSLLVSSKKNKIEIFSFCVPIIFLLVLYNQPSSILLYWTTNNLIFLILILFKNRIK